MREVNRHRTIILRIKVSFAILMSLMILFAYLPISASSSGQNTGKVYYVSTDGSDDNEGTLNSPWRTIQKAADTLIAGETVLVRGGEYNEFVTIRSSGSANGGYITFQAYPGETPIIEGAGLTIGSGKSSLVQIRSANYIVLEGFEIRGLVSSSSSEYPAGVKVQYGGSNIHILNNNIHHIENRSADGNAHGIVVYGNSIVPITDVKISGNRVHHLILGSSESVTLVGNVNRFSVDHNIIHDNNNIGIDIAGYYNTCSGAGCQDQARNGVVADNIVYNIDSATNPAYGVGSKSAGGIYVDGGTNVVIERNRVYNSNFGIELASEKYGKVTSNVIVRNNYLHHNEGAGLIMGGSGTDNGGSMNNIITNNTLYENDTLNQGYGQITFQHYNDRNVIVNNIIYALPKKRFLQKSNSTGSGNIVDYNVYYRTDGVNSASWRWEGTSHKTWDDYKAATGYDEHSIFADPLLKDPANGDISFASQSPVVDSGTTKYGDYGAVDYLGAARVTGKSIDIGAIELYGSIVPAPTAAPTPTIVPTPEATASPMPTAAPTAGPTPTATPTSAPTPAPTATGGDDGSLITVDGSIEDWANIAEQSSSSSNVRSIKTYATSDKLYVLVTGQLLTEKGQLYINTDQNGKNNFEAPFWTDSGSEYLIEDGTLYKYSGTGKTNWAWTKVRSYKSDKQYYASPTAVELAISLSDLGVASANGLQIGYVWKDSSANKLPLSSEMLQMGQGTAIIPTPAPPAKAIVVDGAGSDWKQIGTIATGTALSYKMTNDDSYLYVLIEGSKLNGKVQLYLNSDADERTGYKTSNWSTAGIDYLMEDGRLYQYSGNGSNWSWKRTEKLTESKLFFASEPIVEFAIPLRSLAISKGSVIKAGVLLNDNKSTKLPSAGGMNEYIIQ